MRNKKILNICLCFIALGTMLALIIPKALIPYPESISNGLRTAFWILTGIMLLGVIGSIITTLINLFNDNYFSIKVAEFFALIAFTMNYAIVLMFTLSGIGLAITYVAPSIMTFLLCLTSQIVRLFEGLKDYMARKRLGIATPKESYNSGNQYQSNNFTQNFGNMPYDNYSSQGYKGQYNVAFEPNQNTYDGYSPTNFGQQYGGNYNDYQPNNNQQQPYNPNQNQAYVPSPNQYGYAPLYNEQNQYNPNYSQYNAQNNDYSSSDYAYDNQNISNQNNELDLANELDKGDDIRSYIVKGNNQTTNTTPQNNEPSVPEYNEQPDWNKDNEFTLPDIGAKRATNQNVQNMNTQNVQNMNTQNNPNSPSQFQKQIYNKYVNEKKPTIKFKR